MIINNFSEANAWLAQFVPKPARAAEDYTLDRMWQLMSMLGNPQNNYKVIHIAGTSGKTSTAYYVAALLGQTDQKIGLSVSPHMDEVNERLQVNLQPIPEAAYCQALTKFISLIGGNKIRATYFELLVALAYWQFAEQKVDYAVVEVGLGGLVDGTNVINRPDKVCILTDIGLDHTQMLGTSLREIAAQKAGIVQLGNVVFSYQQSDEIMAVFKKACNAKQADLRVIDEPPNSKLPVALPLFQKHNWYLAAQVVSYVLGRDKLPPLSKEQLASSTVVHVPGRMEIIDYKGKTLILDGAHNVQKMHYLVASIREKFPQQPAAVLVSLLQSKQPQLQAVVEELLPISGHVIVSSFAAQQDLPHQALPAPELAAQFQKAHFGDIEVIEETQSALKALLERPEPLLLITGSLYLLTTIRPLLKQAGVKL